MNLSLQEKQTHNEIDIIEILPGSFAIMVLYKDLLYLLTTHFFL